MQRYLATCSYDGTNFLGFQKQLQGRTVQEEIEKVLSQILNAEISISASGRTDSGVHALAQTFHFDVNKDLDLGKLRYSTNCLLPDDIHVLDIKEVSSDFHARISTKQKHYRYIINMGENDPFTRNYMYNISRSLDVNKMKSGSLLFVGQHNFQNFTSKKEDFQMFIRNIESISILQDGNILTIDFYGNGFMRYMVRMIVGTLIEIGLNKIDYSFIEKGLDSETRNICSYKAPGQGLYLVSVKY